MNEQILTEKIKSELLETLEETFEQHHGIFIDKGTSLFETLENISAEEASRSITENGATVAAHVEHAGFYLDVLERSMRARTIEKIDWREIWGRVGAVSPDECNVGVCLYRLGRIDEAVPFLEAAIKLAKNKYPKAFRALGIVEGELGKPAAAKQAFAAAVRLDRRDGESWFDLAMIHLQEKDFRHAADGFLNAIRYGSVDRATASNNLGVIAAMNDDWLAAEKQFETALAMSGGKLPEAKRNLELCRSLNNAPDLIAKLEFILKKN